VTAWQALEFGAQPVPGLAGGGLGDADQQQGEPAEQDVGADAVLAAVVNGAEIENLLHIAPAALHFQELFVTQRDVLGRQFRIRRAQEVLPVEYYSRRS